MKKCQLAIDQCCDCGKTICCFECDDYKKCSIKCLEKDVSKCEEVIDEPEQVDVVTELEQMSIIKKQIDKLTEQMDSLKKVVLEKMELGKLKKVENDTLKVTYTAPTTRKTFDKDKFLKDHPEIDDDSYMKVSQVKASVKVELK